MSSTASVKYLRALFLRGLDGDAAAYRQFLQIVSDFLRRYLNRRFRCSGRPESEIEDVLQEVLLALHCKRHLYDRDTSFATWVQAIIRYCVTDFERVTSQATDDLSLQDIEALTGSDVTTMDLAIAVRELLAALPEKLRKPIEFMKLRGFSVRETAVATDLSEAAVRVNVHRALRALASALD